MDIILAYYAVAEDVERNARRMLETAESLARIADALSEARMRERKEEPPKDEPQGKKDQSSGESK